MDRFIWSDRLLSTDEQLVINQNGVRLYDGSQKVSRPGSHVNAELRIKISVKKWLVGVDCNRNEFYIQVDTKH